MQTPRSMSSCSMALVIFSACLFLGCNATIFAGEDDETAAAEMGNRARRLFLFLSGTTMPLQLETWPPHPGKKWPEEIEIFAEQKPIKIQIFSYKSQACKRSMQSKSATAKRPCDSLRSTKRTNRLTQSQLQRSRTATASEAVEMTQINGTSAMKILRLLPSRRYEWS